MIEFGWRPPTLSTPRLVVRPFAEVDAASLFRVASNPNVTRYTLWNAHATADDSFHFIRNYAHGQYLHEVPEPMAITPRADVGAIMGAVGCFWTAREHRSMELGYWIAEPNWGHGYATEAAQALLEFVFRNYPVERMQAHCVVENPASARVLEKLGFQFEGIARSAVCLRGTFYDVRRYSILRGEWHV